MIVYIDGDYYVTDKSGVNSVSAHPEAITQTFRIKLTNGHYEIVKVWQQKQKIIDAIKSGSKVSKWIVQEFVGGSFTGGAEGIVGRLAWSKFTDKIILILGVQQRIDLVDGYVIDNGDKSYDVSIGTISSFSMTALIPFPKGFKYCLCSKHTQALHS